MNQHILTVIAQAAIQVAQIFIEKWIDTTGRRKRR
jgi:hypothetical protein